MSRIMTLVLVVGLISGAAAEEIWDWRDADFGGIGLAVVDVYSDVDGDGLRDIIMLGNAGHRIYRAGEAPSPATLLGSGAVANPGVGIAGLLGDVDGSGEPDAASGDQFGSTVRGVLIWRDPTDPNVQTLETNELLNGGTSDWDIGRHRDLDFNGDGRDDFVLTDDYYWHEALLYTLELGQPVVTVLNSSGWTAGIAEIVPDINGDAYPDIVVAEFAYSGSTVIYRLSVIFGGPSPDTVADLVIYPGTRIRDFAWIGDFDGDGEPDLATNGPVRTRFDGQVIPTLRIYRGGSALDDQFDYEIEGFGPQYSYGHEIADGGDADGDGIHSLIVTVASHIAFVYDGGADLESGPDAVIETTSGIDGFDMESIGDWDDDGRSEVVWYRSVYAPRIFDVNDDGIDDLTQFDVLEDCNQNQVPDLYEIERSWFEDCDGNGRIDLCEMAEDPSLDCDGNGRHDVCDVRSASADCDRNGQVDSCELAADPSLDCNGDGAFDACQFDDDDLNCNDNTILDTCEDPGPNSWLDCDNDGLFDSCQIARDPSLDLDLDGRIDGCEQPSRIHLSYDAATDVIDLDASSFGTVDVYVVLDLQPGFDVAAVSSIGFELVPPPGSFLTETEILLPGATDRDIFTDEAFVVDLAEPLPGLGRHVIARLRLITASVPPNALVRLIGPLAFGNPWGLLAPYWADATESLEQIGSFHGAFMNRTFQDCNANEIDDLTDILFEYEADANMNLVPDSCEAATSVPSVVAAHRLLGARPNPFNPRTSIRFELASPEHVHVAIHDVKGRLVRSLVEGHYDAGRHGEVWDGTDDAGRSVASGVYLVRLIAGGRDFRDKVALIR